MKLTVRNLQGGQVSDIDVSDVVFGAPINEPLMHQAIVRQQANQRTGTHATKTRSQVRGGGRKPYRQKGTGRARQGSIRAPHYRTGGIVFGPQPRDYRQAMPRKMRVQALRSAISSRVSDEALLVIESFGLEAPSTKNMREALAGLGATRSALLIVDDAAPEVFLSARNLEKVTPVRASNLNIVAILSHETLIATTAAIRQIEEWLGKPIRKAESDADAAAA